MIKRRARKAGLPTEICAHSFRGAGITEYLRNGGDLEVAARIAGHASIRTTQPRGRLRRSLRSQLIGGLLFPALARGIPT